MKKKKQINTIICIYVLLGVALLILAAIALAAIAQEDESQQLEPVIIEKVITKTEPAKAPEPEKEIITIWVEESPETELTEAEKTLLAQIVHAEAGNQDEIGKRLVADVVLNRMYSSEYPDSAAEVIYQKNQFTTPAQTYDPADTEAVEKELQARLDTDVLYFRAGGYHKGRTKLYQHGDHYFSGR